MHLVDDFNLDVDMVLRDCEKRISSYPSYIKNSGMKYFEKLERINKNKESIGGFAYHMPFWLRDTLALDKETCRIIALGNIFALLYYRSQDDIFDSKPDDWKVNILPLSNMFFMDFISQYRTLFPSSSIFWMYFDKYILEWTNSISWERAEHHGKAAAYSEEDLILLSRKAAPLKIPFAAMCILTNQEHLIAQFSKMVDYDIVTFQLLDDWSDWKNDLANKIYTHFLVTVMKHCHITVASNLNATHISKAVYTGGVLEKILNTALKYNQLAVDSLAAIDSPYLKLYLQMEKDMCEKTKKQISEKRAIITQGGLNSLLERLTGK